MSANKRFAPVIPVVLKSTRASSAAVAAFWAWRAFFEASGSDYFAHGWVPVAMLGPVLIIGHTDADALCQLPDYAVQRVLMSREDYERFREIPACDIEFVAPVRMGVSHTSELAAVLSDYAESFPCDREIRAMLLSAATDSAVKVPSEYLALIERVQSPAPWPVLDPRIIVPPKTDDLHFDSAVHGGAVVVSRSDTGVVYLCSTQKADYGASDYLESAGASRVVTVQCPEVVLKDFHRRMGQGGVKRATEGSGETSDSYRSQLGFKATVAMEVREVAAGFVPHTTDVSEGFIDRLCQWVFWSAIREGASDIHMEPLDGRGLIRIRIGGDLVRLTKQTIPLETFYALVSRVKRLAKMDFDIGWNEQDGNVSMRVWRGENNPVLYGGRIACIPVIGYEQQKTVCRILEKSGSPPSISRLKLLERDEMLFRWILRQQDGGATISSGPTGSGKSYLLAALLAHLTTEETSTQTLEDPVEYEISGVNQSQVDMGRKVTFNSLGRVVLRVDPDVLMIGEIRDEDTAAVLMKAALTGHPAFSTLHANDASGVIDRMLGLKVGREILAQGLNAAIAQRLLRALCPHCRERVEFSGETKRKVLAVFRPKEHAEIEAVQHIYRRCESGCSYCRDGYADRQAIFEILPMERGGELASIILAGGTARDVRKRATEMGFDTLYSNALRHVLRGTFSFEQAEAFDGRLDLTNF